MFGLFKKPPSGPKELVFKSNEAAFQYACAYLSTSLADENPVLGIVLAAKGEKDYCVKLSNDTNPGIPTESPQQLLDNGTIDNICFHAVAADGIGELSKGDLVMYIAPATIAALGKGHMAGVIVAKVKPIYSMEHGGWVNDI